MTAETPGNARITSFRTEDEANAAARRLLEAGVPPVVEADTDPVSLQPRHWVTTLPNDASRAFEVLGVNPPERIDVTPDTAPISKEQSRWRIPRDKVGRYVALYIFLLVVVCSSVFLVTVWILGGLDEELELPPDHPLNSTSTTN